MKKGKKLRVAGGIIALVTLFFLCLPTYMRNALIHWYPDISDTYLFDSHAVTKADTCWEWPVAPDYNTYVLDSTDRAYTALFSKTTQAYYGDEIRKLVMSLEAVEEAGKKYSYKSGDTQLLSFVLEAATGQTISAYAEEKLWKPMQACNDALWNLDKKGGDEKSYCCFNSTARDIARFARLMLHKGNWNGKQLVSEAYLQEAMSPAAYLENEFGDGPLDYYGFQIWIMHYRGMQFPAFRGLGGQYLFAIPQKNAIVVRFGHKRSELYEREKTVDMDGYLDIAFKILAERE